MAEYFRYIKSQNKEWISEKNIDFGNIGEQSTVSKMVADNNIWQLTDEEYYYQICNLEISDKIVRLIYDSETEQIYAFQLDYNGQPYSQYDANTGNNYIEIFALFPGQNIELKNRWQYELRYENSIYRDVSVTLYNNAKELYQDSQSLRMIFGEDVDADDINMKLLSPVAQVEEETTEIATEEDTESMIEVETEIWTEIESVDSTEVSTTLESIGENSVETESVTLIEASVDTVFSEKDNDKSSLLAVVLIIAAMLGLVAVGTAGFFFMKNHKQETEKKQLKNQLSEMQNLSSNTEIEMANKINELQKENKVLRSDCDAMQNAMCQREKELKALQDKIQNLTNDAQAQCDNLNHLLQIEKAKNSGGNAEVVAWQATEIAQKTQQLSVLQQQVQELQMKLQSAEQNYTSEIKTSPNISVALAPDVMAKQIALSTQMADQLRDVQYLSVTASLTGDVMLSAASSYRTAPILVNGTAAMLNPYYYKGLATGREQYENLIHICSIFDVEGLNGSGIGYTLQYIMPAIVRMGTDGTYQVVQKGKLILK